MQVEILPAPMFALPMKNGASYGTVNTVQFG